MAPTQQTEQRRLNSLIRREMRDGVPVYVKQSLVGDWNASVEQVQQRVVREANVMRRVAASGSFRGRLGVLDLVDWKRNEATIVTREVAGQPLQDYLVGSYRRRPAGECMRALLLAGRWLNTFQNLPLEEQDHLIISDQSPRELVEYCDIRLRNLKSLGYSKLKHDSRRLLNSVRDSVDQSSAKDVDLVLCHCDFGAFNILWDSHVITGIDFSEAQASVPLLDVTYFIHRMSMLPIYFPWKHWPVRRWQEAFLKGYGRPRAAESPMYRALMIRHLLCRLQTYVRRPGRGVRQKVHTRWVIDRVYRQLIRTITTDQTEFIKN